MNPEIPTVGFVKKDTQQSPFNDFNDVFGGPQRRYSSQDARHGMSSEARELSRYRGRRGGGGDEEGAVMSGGVRPNENKIIRDEVHLAEIANKSTPKIIGLSSFLNRGRRGRRRRNLPVCASHFHDIRYVAFMGTVSFDVVPVIKHKHAPGSVYRSPQVYEKLKPKMESDNSTADAVLGRDSGIRQGEQEILNGDVGGGSS